MIILSRNYRAGNNAMRDFTGGDHAPEGDEQLAGEGHDHLRFACTAGPLGPSAEPLGQRAVLLKQQKLCSFPPLSNTRSVPFWMNFVSRFDSSRILGGVAPELIAYVEVILRTPGLAARFRSGPFSDVWLIDARFGGPGPSAKKPPATGDTHPTGVKTIATNPGRRKGVYWSLGAAEEESVMTRVPAIGICAIIVLGSATSACTSGGGNSVATSPAATSPAATSGNCPPGICVGSTPGQTPSGPTR